MLIILALAAWAILMAVYRSSAETETGLRKLFYRSTYLAAPALALTGVILALVE